MPWSTRELAELAGTTVNTVRHYHHLGLLDEPVRRHNGYKQYEVSHLMAMLRIRRLVDLGVPLSQIGELEGTPSENQALHEIDAELARSIERLQRARAGIAAILREQAPADIPTGFESVASRMSEADRSMAHLYARVYDDDALADLRSTIESSDAAVEAEIASLAPDADAETVERLAEQIAPSLARNLLEHPWLADPASRLAVDQASTRKALVESVKALYNPAQLDVFVKASARAHELVDQMRASGDEPPAVDAD